MLSGSGIEDQRNWQSKGVQILRRKAANFFFGKQQYKSEKNQHDDLKVTNVE